MIRLLLILIAAALVGTGIAQLVDVEGGLEFTMGTHEVSANVPVAIFLLSVAALLTLLGVRLIIALIATPRRVSAWVRGRRARRGFQALSRGLVAAAAGDAQEARRFARRSSAGI